jgi:hypothetical protein
MKPSVYVQINPDVEIMKGDHLSSVSAIIVQTPAGKSDIDPPTVVAQLRGAMSCGSSTIGVRERPITSYGARSGRLAEQLATLRGTVVASPLRKNSLYADRH